MSDTALAKLDPHGRAEYWASLALRRSKGLGARTIHQLLLHFGSAYEAVHQVAQWSKARVNPEKGAALASDEWREAARPEWEDSRDLDGEILLWTDPRYPASLRELPDAPVLLYCRGDISLLNNPCVGIVGSRACLPRSLTIAHTMSKQLAESGVTVVSGMARGIDYAAHSGALAGQGGTIAVLGSGLDIIYPPSHSDLYRALGLRGLLISEFPPGSLPQGQFFPIRNRIISGLSFGVVVVEAAQRSGSLVTARLALEQNRAVYAVPPDWLERSENGEADSAERAGAGCAALIEQGAKPVRHAADVLTDLAPLLLSTLHCSMAAEYVETESEDDGRAEQDAQDEQDEQDEQDAQDYSVPCVADAFPGLYARVLRVENRERQDAQQAKDSADLNPPFGTTATIIAKAAAKSGATPAIKKAKAAPSSTTSTVPGTAPLGSSAPLAPPAPQAPPVRLSPPDSPESFVLDLLRQGPQHPDDILGAILAAASRFSFLDPAMNAGSLSALLIMQEVRGAIKLLPGQMYTLP